MSAEILPDTCAWIDFLRGTPTPLATAVEKGLRSGTVITCGVVLYELTQGIKNPAEEATLIAAFAAIPCLEPTRQEWIEAGRLSARLRRQGVTLPLSDLLIAVLAQKRNATVLTVDRHFEQVPGVRVAAE